MYSNIFAKSASYTISIPGLGQRKNRLRVGGSKCTQGITKAAVRPQTQRGGVKHVSGLIHEETRNFTNFRP